MRRDLLDELAKLSPVESVVVATYNVDLEFLDAIVVPFLRRRGSARMTVIADGEQAREAFRRVPDSRHLGSYYRLVPVDLGGPAFHPKFVAARGSGGQQMCWIGSGNLTYGGWRGNAELWHQFDGLPEGFEAFLRGVADRVTGNESLWPELDAFLTFDAPLGANLAFQTGSEVPIGVKLLTELSGNGDHVVLSPYVDASGTALARLDDGWEGVEWWVQDGESGMSSNGLASLPASVVPKVVTFTSTKKQRPFVHAKLYAAVGVDEVRVAVGSANCSQRALFLHGDEANIELMSFATIPRGEWNELVDQLEIAKQVPRVSPQPAASASRREPAFISDARLDGDLLTVALTEKMTGVIRLIPQGDEFNFSDECEVRRRVNAVPRAVEVEVGEQVSAQQWVHLERELSRDAKARSLGRFIRQQVGDEFTPTSWGQLMELFAEQVRPSHRGGGGTTRRNRNQTQGEGDRIEFSLDDAYSVPPELSFQGRGGGQLPRLASSLRDAVLGLLGERWREEDPPPPPPSSSPSNDESQPNRKKTSTKTQRDSVRAAERAIEKFLDAAPKRSGVEISHDLKILGFMLVMGEAQGWLSSDAFVEASQRVWSEVFVKGIKDGRRYAGLLEELHSQARDQEAFQANVGDPEFVAILALWGQRTSELSSGSIALSLLYAVARNLWLWARNDAHTIEAALDRFVSSLSLGTSFEELAYWWNSQMRYGAALREFEQRMTSRSLAEWRAQLDEGEVTAGEFAWQGPDLRLCRVSSGGHRTPSAKLELESVVRNERARVRGDFALPVAALLALPEFRDIKTGVLSAIESLTPS